MGEKYSHLSLSEREEISRGLASGSSLLAIANRLGRNRGTISRKVVGFPGTSGISVGAFLISRSLLQYASLPFLQTRLK